MTVPATRVLTIGHGNRSLAELIGLLEAHGVGLLCDVRAFPGSRRHPQFAKGNLERALPEAGISYEWLGKELGGHRRTGLPDSPNTALRDEGLRNYADHMSSAGFVAAVERLLEQARVRRVAVMCAERDPKRCHRSYLADHLLGVRGVRVQHIFDAEPPVPHRLRASARVDAGRVVYDVGANRQGMLFE